VAIERRYVLGAVFAFAAIGTAVLVADVLTTVCFAVTVACLLVPLHEELTRRGLSTWWASLTATTAALAVVALALPLFPRGAVPYDHCASPSANRPPRSVHSARLPS
jgi:predicted PurR-regulated permease PerM